MKTLKRIALLAAMAAVVLASLAHADPCGMVPPIYTGPGVPITRIGHQQTYVFYDGGVESFVIRPGFEGKVEEFGMLIPFPNPPAIRKVSDNIFEHLANAVDPPEVVVYAGPGQPMAFAEGAGYGRAGGGMRVRSAALAKDAVNVLSEEAVGMYEVAVLEAGSAGALKKWMEQHKYRFPDGMEGVCNDYVNDSWCFVAVKTKVNGKSGVDPRPGQRDVKTGLPAGATFDGFVQAMGFRFKTDELVVPMRLSAFNGGDLRNIVYLLTDGPRRIRSIPEEFVVRQLDGEQLVKNLTGPLPLRIMGGGVEDLNEWNYRGLAARRDPYPRNGAAKELFTSDVQSASSGEMSLRHERREKELLRIGERLGLRGPNVDRLNKAAIQEDLDKTTEAALAALKKMTLTVVDGDFPREVISSQNLTFDEFRMPGAKNSSTVYHCVQKGPQQNIRKDGTLILESLPVPEKIKKQMKKGERRSSSVDPQRYRKRNWSRALMTLGSLFGLVLVGGRLTWGTRKSNQIAAGLLIGAFLLVLGGDKVHAEEPATGNSAGLSELVKQLDDDSTAKTATDGLVAMASEQSQRDGVVQKLIALAKNDQAEITARGWAIAALGEIGGLDIDEALLSIHRAPKQNGKKDELDGLFSPGRPRGRIAPGYYPPQSDPATEQQLVQTWAAAARVAMCKSPDALIEKAQLIDQFPPLGRPISQRLVAQMSGDDVSLEKMLKVSTEVYQVAGPLTPAIMARGADELLDVMTASEDQNIRRQAAAYLASLGAQDTDGVSEAVIERYKFDGAAESEPWKGGPLFVPSLNWSKANATELMRQLVGWDIKAYQDDDMEVQRQLHNNLRNLAQRIGIQRQRGRTRDGFNWQFNSPREWFQLWGKQAGQDEARSLLEEVGVPQNSPFWRALKRL